MAAAQKEAAAQDDDILPKVWEYVRVGFSFFFLRQTKQKVNLNQTLRYPGDLELINLLPGSNTCLQAIGVAEK